MPQVTHGAVLDVGPRQAAYLMSGPDRVHFPVSLAPGCDEMQALMNQGVGQLHAYWFFEAERSFRQVLAEDPDCAMAYWGLALSNANQPKRAAWFARAAWLKRGLATAQERMYIDMLARFHSVEGPDEPADLRQVRNPAAGEEKDPGAPEEAQREPPTRADAERLVKDYEELIRAYPDDIEAKALLANRIWLNVQLGIAIANPMAAESLLREVFAVEPMHPAHHYRIHLLDAQGSPARAIGSAAKCGPAWPSSAHMWHMGGQVFARLGRHYDAAWQLEAAARVDHSYMARNWILPDEVFDFSNNSEWLARSLRRQGRVSESVEVVKAMIELPRHPAFNTLETPRASTTYGRRQLLETLTLFEQWETLRDLGATMYLEPDARDADGAMGAYALGQAAVQLGDGDGLGTSIASLESMPERIDSLRALEVLQRDPDDRKALRSLEVSHFESVHLARMMVEAGRRTGDSELMGDAVRLARAAAEDADGRLLEHATLAYVLWTAGQRERALDVYRRLREGAALAELDLPPLRRLAPLAAELGLPLDWRPALRPAEDLGTRIALDTLGPRYWTPPIAPDWTLSDAFGIDHSLSEYRGRPVLVVFYLGFGCIHCVEQLQAIAPEAQHFADAGIDVVAIGLQTVEEMARALGTDPADTGFPFPLLADPTLEHFRAWRAYDDFEGIALHGTYLVDGAGRVRWMDISHLPFMDVEFLLHEFRRLLALPARDDDRTPTGAPRDSGDSPRSDAQDRPAPPGPGPGTRSRSGGR